MKITSNLSVGRMRETFFLFIICFQLGAPFSIVFSYSFIYLFISFLFWFVRIVLLCIAVKILPINLFSVLCDGSSSSSSNTTIEKNFS